MGCGSLRAWQSPASVDAGADEGAHVLPEVNIRSSSSSSNSSSGWHKLLRTRWMSSKSSSLSEQNSRVRGRVVGRVFMSRHAG
jgi:hypothetical protein